MVSELPLVSSYVHISKKNSKYQTDLTVLIAVLSCLEVCIYFLN